MMEKARHGEHVAAFLFVLAVHGVDGAADKYPERLFQVVEAQGVGMVAEQAQLFVEREQIAQQEQTGLSLTPIPFPTGRGGRVVQVEDAEVLAVAVAVEVAVGIVEDDGFAVFGGERVVARRAERLPEGGAVLEGEVGRAQGIAVFAPGFAAAAFVSLSTKMRLRPSKASTGTLTPPPRFSSTSLVISMTCTALRSPLHRPRWFRSKRRAGMPEASSSARCCSLSPSLGVMSRMLFSGLLL